MQASNGQNANESAGEQVKTQFRLISVASKHLAIYGYDGMSLRKVAEEVGVSPAAVYRHFPEGKAQLYDATLALVAENMSKVMQGRAGGDDIVDVIVQQCSQIWTFFAENPNVAAMLVRENITGGHTPNTPSPYTEQHEENISMTREMLTQAIKQKRVKAINISSFLFYVTTFVTNFHGCHALREIVWTEDETEQDAKKEFLKNIDDRLRIGE